MVKRFKIDKETYWDYLRLAGTSSTDFSNKAGTSVVSMSQLTNKKITRVAASNKLMKRIIDSFQEFGVKADRDKLFYGIERGGVANKK